MKLSCLGYTSTLAPSKVFGEGELFRAIRCKADGFVFEGGMGKFQCLNCKKKFKAIPDARVVCPYCDSKYVKWTNHGKKK